MTDYSELKRMAEHHLSLGHAYTVATPSVLLSLIADLDDQALQTRAARGVALESQAAILQLLAERDQLKAENAGLKTGYESYDRVNAGLKAENEALRKHAERYRWLRDSECAGRILRDMGAKVCRHADQRIDAAMGKGEQS